ncbi:MAG TPA: hypothetical protein VLS25_02145 [Dehalococcoidia bacterium]|nr:hypothetical protein [Dehalococcoidia bacterium]
MRKAIQRFMDDETGHIQVGLPALLAAIGAVVLGYGAAADKDVITVIGGWVLGLGIMAASVARHRSIDYDLYRRLEILEKK